MRPFSTREIEHKNFLIPVDIGENEEIDIFIRYKSSGTLEIPLQLVSYKSLLEDEYISQYIQGIYYGIMVIMIFYNLFLFISVKDKGYLYYILYILGISIFTGLYTGYGFQFFFRDLPLLANKLLAFTIGATFLSTGIFSINFLNLKEKSKIMFWILFVLNIIMLIAMLLSLFIPYAIIIKIFAVLALIFSIIAYISGIESYRKGWKPARFYIIAWTFLWIGVFVVAAKQLALLPSNFFTNYSVQFGSAVEVVLLSSALADKINILREENEKAQSDLLETKILMLDSFSRFVPKHFANLLQKESILEIQPGDAIEKEITVLFNDIKNFTGISEKLSPKETIKLLNRYFEVMNPIIVKYRGFIDKFIGDEIMALFEGEVDNSLDSAIRMIESLREVNQRIEREGLAIQKIVAGIGINHGKLVLGTVGSHIRLDTTVIGDTVNTAARIQQLTREFEVPILLTGDAVSSIKERDKYLIRELQSVKVKGKEKLIRLYECFNSDDEELKEWKLKTLPQYEEGVQLYKEKKYLEAAGIFRELYEKNIRDNVIKLWLDFFNSYFID